MVARLLSTAKVPTHVPSPVSLRINMGVTEHSTGGLFMALWFHLNIPPKLRPHVQKVIPKSETRIGSPSQPVLLGKIPPLHNMQSEDSLHVESLPSPIRLTRKERMMAFTCCGCSSSTSKHAPMVPQLPMLKTAEYLSHLKLDHLH